MGVSLDLDVSRVVEMPTALLTTEGDGPANHAQFPLADLPARLRTLAPADRKVALAGAADAVVAQARSLAPAFGVVDRVDRIGQRVGMKSDALRHLATDVLASTDSRVDALKLHPSDLPGVLWRATSTTKIGPLTGPLFRGTPTPVKGAVSACFLTGPGRDGIVWTSGEHEARTGAEQAARISAAACAAALVRAQARDQDPFVPDPIWTRAVAHLANDTAAFVVGDDAERSARAVGRLLALRQAAVGVLVATEATAPDGAALDAAATRWASPSLSPVAGAGALLNVDAAGREAENFVALLLASALEHALVVQHGMAWTRRGREVESLQTLQRLGAKFEAGGALEVFRQVGETTVSAALLITAYDVMRGESATGQ